MTILVTGATGFIGRAIVRKLADGNDAEGIRLVDRGNRPPEPDSRFESIVADITDPATLPNLLDDVRTVMHLVSLPGGSAEADPVESRRLNLDATLALVEGLVRYGAPSPRFIFCSSIAVFGHFADPVCTDNTRPYPILTYGAHKLMAEIGLSDWHRRGALETISLRLPGIVARAGAPSGLKSAFMSEMFHAAREKRQFTFPVGADATLWLMSAEQAAANLIHAARLPQLPGEAVTLPAMRVRVGDFARHLFDDASQFDFDPEVGLEETFGRYPLLEAKRALALGFRADANVDALVKAAMAEA